MAILLPLCSMATQMTILFLVPKTVISTMLFLPQLIRPKAFDASPLGHSLFSVPLGPGQATALVWSLPPNTWARWLLPYPSHSLTCCHCQLPKTQSDHSFSFKRGVRFMFCYICIKTSGKIHQRGVCMVQSIK